MFCNITIIGVGLIGGSLALALKHHSLVGKITGFDTNAENIKLAIDARAIDAVATDIYQSVKDADLVVLATPVLTSEELLVKIAGHLKQDTVVTDVGSTKVKITKLAAAQLVSGVHFIGGHPMAGSEVTGMRGADPYLFENAYYILTPTEFTNRVALQALKELLTAIGAKVVELDPEQHDQTVAMISHLPHLVAVSLVNTLAGNPNYPNMIPFAAGGFRDTTRIAASSPVMWRDIFQTNKEQVLKSIKDFKLVLDEYEQLITEEDGINLQNKLDQARNTRRLVPGRIKGYLPMLYEILLTVPDKPGVIAEFAALLGNNKVNITDLEILRVREGQGGTIRLAFATEKEQLKALKVLTNSGYQAHIR